MKTVDIQSSHLGYREVAKEQLKCPVFESWRWTTPAMNEQQGAPWASIQESKQHTEGCEAQNTA